ncbi:hypothetical protein ACJIZ3_001909 [Penstemon smallii]|uniref:Uncharacterized protein n=1 Tax=Penstemon smallii TaxID=265156 RepID=A0ABD3U4Z9_9LAMI
MTTKKSSLTNLERRRLRLLRPSLHRRLRGNWNSKICYPHSHTNFKFSHSIYLCTLFHSLDEIYVCRYSL